AQVWTGEGGPVRGMRAAGASLRDISAALEHKGFRPRSVPLVSERGATHRGYVAGTGPQRCGRARWRPDKGFTTGLIRRAAGSVERQQRPLPPGLYLEG